MQALTKPQQPSSICCFVAGNEFKVPKQNSLGPAICSSTTNQARVVSYPVIIITSSEGVGMHACRGEVPMHWVVPAMGSVGGAGVLAKKKLEHRSTCHCPCFAPKWSNLDTGLVVAR